MMLAWYEWLWITCCLIVIFGIVGLVRAEIRRASDRACETLTQLIITLEAVRMELQLERERRKSWLTG